jgi:hypothetical protein
VQWHYSVFHGHITFYQSTNLLNICFFEFYKVSSPTLLQKNLFKEQHILNFSFFHEKRSPAALYTPAYPLGPINAKRYVSRLYWLIIRIYIHVQHILCLSFNKVTSVSAWRAHNKIRNWIVQRTVVTRYLSQCIFTEICCGIRKL